MFYKPQLTIVMQKEKKIESKRQRSSLATCSFQEFDETGLNLQYNIKKRNGHRTAPRNDRNTNLEYPSCDLPFPIRR